MGPVNSPTEDRSPTLRSVDTRSLQVAAELGAHTVAFPMISSGVYGWPIPDAHQAITAILNSGTTIHDVTMVAFSADWGSSPRSR